MKIIMTQTVPGSVDGIRVSTYESDVEYDLTATEGERDLAAAFVNAGFAQEVGAERPAAPEVEADAGTEGAPAAPRPGRRPRAQ
jgi:hypothetical protein